jgi:hypothetical protein
MTFHGGTSMRGSLRLTLITGATLASLLIGSTGLVALASAPGENGNGRGRSQQTGQQTQPPGQVRQAERGEDDDQQEQSDDREERGSRGGSSSVSGLSADLVTSPARPTGEARPESRECPDGDDDDFEYQNHGHAVSCAAHSEEAEDGENHGQMVREVAQSDEGKSNQEQDEDED